MFKWIITLIFINFIAVIYAPDPVIVPNSSVTNENEAAQKLSPIQCGEALPVVLFITRHTGTQHKLQVPEEIVGVVTVSEKMVEGTLFSMTGSNTQIFFCPKENSNEKCLAPREFEDYTPLQCSKEPMPVVMEDTSSSISCGFQYDSNSYTMGYDICPREEPYKYQKSKLGLYRFCYDNKKKKILYTTHFIMSPKLLDSNLLLREQELTYPYLANDGFQTANHVEIRNSLLLENLTFYTKQFNVSGIELAFTLTNSWYQVQKLVPSDDMALGSWRKTTYRYVNTELQHKWIFPFWNEINDMVRKEAIQTYKHDINFHVRTGVFDITSDPFEGDEKILYNMWVKVITSVSKDKSKTLQGVVILMNNFLNSNIKNSQLISLKNKIDTYCHYDLCAKSIKNRVAVRMRCCQTTTEIAQLFGPEIIEVNLPVLEIPGLTEIPT